MSLINIFGINAVGKDTVANAIKVKHPQFSITSESRLLMFNLGYIDNYETSYPISKESYRKLENTNQSDIIQITNTSYKDTLIKFHSSNKNIILLSHLVFALNVDKEKPVYLDKRELPIFLPDVVDCFIQLVSSPEEIYRRRISDNMDGIRDRGFTSKNEIIKHQDLCNIKWDKLISRIPKDRYITILNDNLNLAVKLSYNFIDNFNKNKHQLSNKELSTRNITHQI